LGSALRILIVDDSRSSLAFLRQVVGELGFTGIECVLHPVEALRRATEVQFDVVIVDNIMPVMTAWN
jgi:putative two-component system response regulator